MGLPYNSKERYDHYKYMLKGEDIEDLAVLMQRMNVNEQYTPQQKIRLQGYVNCCEPIFFGFLTTLVSERPKYDIYVSFLKDDFTYNPYAFAFHISSDINLSEELTYCLNKSYYQKDKTQREDAFCEITKRFIKALYSILDYMNDEEESCLFYVYDNNEMYNIKNFLSDLVSSQGKDLKSLESEEKEDVVKKATKCLVALFQDGTLLDVPTLEELPCLDKIEKNAMTERFVVIEQLLEQNVALPAQVYYEVSDAVKWMVDRKAVVYNFKKEWEKFSRNKTGNYEKEWITVLNLDKDNRTVNLRADLGSKTPDQRFRLYKIYEDKNENHPFKNMFEALDEATKKSIVDLLQDPNEWSMKDTFGDIDFNSPETKKSLNKFSLLCSQQEAVESIMKRRLQLIWGSVSLTYVYE
ncbi:hypothetical protein CU097_015394 [Rhizopus azygosporus]|uniref:Uncharacterized protein n=1 Tax=Rhizopus azygosporus TaxID=86630 RepID=A0A367KAI3_RHIAZ|nr:hypothetical protein CU097_015394 [Rhizopus azygosporus]